MEIRGICLIIKYDSQTVITSHIFDSWNNES